MFPRQPNEDVAAQAVVGLRPRAARSRVAGVPSHAFELRPSSLRMRYSVATGADSNAGKARHTVAAEWGTHLRTGGRDAVDCGVARDARVVAAGAVLGRGVDRGAAFRDTKAGRRVATPSGPSVTFSRQGCARERLGMQALPSCE